MFVNWYIFDLQVTTLGLLNFDGRKQGLKVASAETLKQL